MGKTEELSTEIKAALVKFAYADLIEGSQVRDVLLDLLNLVQGTDAGSTPEYGPDGQMYATSSYVGKV